MFENDPRIVVSHKKQMYKYFIPFIKLIGGNNLTSLPSEIGLMTNLQTLNLGEFEC